MAIEGFWYPRLSSRQYPAVLEFTGVLKLYSQTDGALLHQADGKTAVISSRLGNTPRQIEFPDDVGKFETNDNDAVDALLPKIMGKSKGTFIHRLESHWRLVFLSVILLVAFVWSTERYGIPEVAKVIAFNLPASVMDEASKQTLALLDKTMFKPSELPKAQTQQIAEDFKKSYRSFDPKRSLNIIFRHSDKMGANAIALPDGTVVVTDELVSLAANEQELFGVLAHEAGHVRYRHGLQSMIHASLLGILALTLTGDTTGVAHSIAGLSVALVQQSYSRHFEQQADDNAKAFMTQKGIQPINLANLLDRIGLSEQCVSAYFSADKHENKKRQDFEKNCMTVKALTAFKQSDKYTDKPVAHDELDDYLSSHPNNAERRARLLKP